VGLENFIIAIAREDDTVVDVVSTETLENEPFFASRERDLIQALKETLQSPPPGPFQKHDINWLPHVTTGHGLYNHIENAVIPWDQLEDFVQREHNYLELPYKFTRTKEHKICNPPNTLTHLKKNSTLLVYKCYSIFEFVFFQSNALFFNCLLPSIISFTSGFLNVAHVKISIFWAPS
jgi:hypothetical protein